MVEEVDDRVLYAWFEGKINDDILRYCISMVCSYYPDIDSKLVTFLKSVDIVLCWPSHDPEYRLWLSNL